MAKQPDIFVQIGKVTTKKFDVDSGATPPLDAAKATDVMREVAQGALKRFTSKGITITAPKGKQARGYELSISLDSVTPVKADYKLQQTVHVGLWKQVKPRASIQKKAKASRSMLLEGIEAVTESAVKDALSTILKKLGPP